MSNQKSSTPPISEEPIAPEMVQPPFRIGLYVVDPTATVAQMTELDGAEWASALRAAAAAAAGQAPARNRQTGAVA